MSRKRSSELDALLEEILTDAEGDEEQLWALREALEQQVTVPCPATMAGEPVTVVKFDYDGNARRGLTATIVPPDGPKYVVSAADVALEEANSHRYIAAYRQWMGLAPLKTPTRRASQSQSLDVVVLSLSARAAWCRILPTGEEIALRINRLLPVIPGEIATIRSGKIEAVRLDAKAMGVTPLRLEPFDDWDPAEEYWGEPGDPTDAWAKKIIQRGRRPRFEMEQVIPGEDPEDRLNDPILESNDRRDAGDVAGAYDILMGLCRADLRCLDAHSHLGNLLFDARPKHAIRHYEVGVRIGELSLPADFDGVLSWLLIGNRPFLRCLHGYGLCLWRLKRFEESLGVFERLLWLNPSDNQGVRFIVDQVRKKQAWRPGH